MKVVNDHFDQMQSGKQSRTAHNFVAVIISWHATWYIYDAMKPLD